MIAGVECALDSLFADTGARDSSSRRLQQLTAGITSLREEKLGTKLAIVGLGVVVNLNPREHGYGSADPIGMDASVRKIRQWLN